MMKRRTALRWGILLITLLTLQTSLFPIFAWQGIAPNFVLLFTVSIGYVCGAWPGAMAGAITGLLQGLATGDFLGVAMFCQAAIGYGVGTFSRTLLKDSLILPAVAVLGATAADYVLTFFFLLLVGYRYPLMYDLVHVLLPMLVWNFALGYPVHRAVLYILAKEEK